MQVFLGPIPDHLREVLRERIERFKIEAPGSVEEAINALVVTGGPGGTSYLDADGQFWDWFPLSSNEPTRVVDESRKLLLALGAVERWPDLACWLPNRPCNAEDCKKCSGTGKILLIKDFIFHCTDCNGLGWKPVQ